MNPEEKRRKEIEDMTSSVLWISIVVIYLLLGFIGDFGAYSWIIFIIGAAIQNLIHLLFKLKEK